VEDYAHWNEEAYAVWYAENRYDMEHADEELDDDPHDGMYDEPEEEDEEELCTGNSETCPVEHTDDPEGLCPEER